MSEIISFEHALEDVETRFLYNLPESELSSTDRLFFQIESAWWFYEDFFVDKYPSGTCIPFIIAYSVLSN